MNDKKIIEDLVGESMDDMGLNNHFDEDNIIKKECTECGNENLLIAEFMGGIEMNKGIHFTKQFMKEIKGNSIYFEETMEFESSWDWLMPVYERIINDIGTTHEDDDIYDAFANLSIKTMYETAVNYIKRHNEEE